MSKLNLKPKDWIAWLGATLVAAMTYTAFAYSTFQTKDESRHVQQYFVERLNRFETKLDRVLENNRK